MNVDYSYIKKGVNTMIYILLIALITGTVAAANMRA